ncbi:ABC transporter permease [Natronococcus occultus]|uniref:ABC-type transport system involved in multi-copper enzyme maturation, permease component n=1 Tax=Natronococcus occultus SP4 TaxID=694430 RepID=L0K5R9_9EURY|nr:ABC transporter permease subunit [Natronococcus occultus]AGB39870.1 ABC-type transport system involved in multi-copper enzyme maturation, permease component [Natronococcus occultus SP4]
MTDPQAARRRTEGDEDEPRPRADGGYGTIADAGLGRTSESGDWYRQLLVVAETEYRLAVRGRWAIALTVVFAAFALGLTTFSGSDASPEGFERTVASLAVLAVYLVPLVALAFGYDAVVGREESGWLRTLFALPVERAWIVVGTLLGRAVVLASATILGFGIAGSFLLLEFGLGGFDAYVQFLLAAVGLGLVFLAIAVLVSTLAREKTHALGIALLIWAWFVLVHDLLGLGIVAAFDLSGTAVSAMLLANPTGIFRALVLGTLGAAGDAGFATVLAESGLSTGVLMGALVAWIVVPTVLAALAIRRRRL